MKKGMEISMNFIIIAIIALVVLVVSIYFIVQAIGPTNEARNSCVTRGGQCVSPDGNSCPDRMLPLIGVKCEGSMKCCVGA